MTKNIKQLIKSKELIEKKINLNETLLETIKILKQDETMINEENKDNNFYYRCDYCKCNHVLCKECNDKYLINK